MLPHNGGPSHVIDVCVENESMAEILSPKPLGRRSGVRLGSR
jgi:hypothetical protein